MQVCIIISKGKGKGSPYSWSSVGARDDQSL